MISCAWVWRWLVEFCCDLGVGCLIMLTLRVILIVFIGACVLEAFEMWLVVWCLLWGI